MYHIYINDKEESYPIYEPVDDEVQIFNPVLTQEVGVAGKFEFNIHMKHPYADKISLLRGELVIYDEEEPIFYGRVLSTKYNMQNMISVTCEGDLTYLLDSQQRPFEYTGNISGFIGFLLNIHNSQADEDKLIYPGIINVVGEGNITRSNTEITKTLEILMAQLVEVNGGYLRIRRSEGKKYLDYLWDFGGINSQVIRFGENLVDLSRFIESGSIVTCLIPVGANVEYTDAMGEKQVKTVDITSVNHGLDYIQSDAGIERYGKRWGSYKWEDVTEPAELLAKANAYLQDAVALPSTLEINAIDLSLLDSDIQRFRLGYWTEISSEPHRVETKMLLTRKVINLTDPTAGSITLGKKQQDLIDGMISDHREAMKAVSKTAESASEEIKRKVDNATSLITGGLGGYVVLDNIDPLTGEKMHPWRILIMNTPEKETAKNVIQFNQNGIGFSTSGINGPYRNAWTIDGNLIADFITGGTMLADRIRGGMLEIGGKGLGKDGKIVVKDAEDREIGYWDKTGLHVLLGVISGTKIIGSSIIGGVIDIGNGTFSVDSDGSVAISSGEISIGNVEIKENYTWLGDFGISSNDSGLFYSRDSAKSVQIASSSWFDWNYYPHIQLQKGDERVSIDPRGIGTKDISLDVLKHEYGDSWGLVSKNIIELWNKIAEIKSQLQ